MFYDSDWNRFIAVLIGIGVLIGFGLFFGLPWLWDVALRPLLMVLVS
tara:strand:- start:41352 stop:41492 length:141 start_codon:yes stop_codon:yes gene_type:complete